MCGGCASTHDIEVSTWHAISSNDIGYYKVILNCCNAFHEQGKTQWFKKIKQCKVLTAFMVCKKVI